MRKKVDANIKKKNNPRVKKKKNQEDAFIVKIEGVNKGGINPD